MVREFKLINEKGQEFSLMDIKNYVLLTDPDGLGYGYDNEYLQIEDDFVLISHKLSQGEFNGTVNALKYDNLRNLANFIESSEKIRLSYTIPYESGTKTFLRDSVLATLDKTQKQTNGVLSEPISFQFTSLWYSEDVTTYGATEEDEMRWDYRWDARYVDFNLRNLAYDNKGHTEAPVLIEIDGPVVNPSISLYVNREEVTTITFTVTLLQDEKLLYSTKTGDLYIYKQEADGDLINLFSETYGIDLTNDNIIMLPKGVSEIILSAGEGTITSAQITIYPQYKFV